ncbi:E3 ubiquitin-protein ligase RNF31 [Phalacrocorax carbo]|uniref:E3 ubiquitin-protein ligase RNF31 n=1 Tax=Phalacrocorax carbo TaxID=9209 RepID=UPI0031192D3B
MAEEAEPRAPVLAEGGSQGAPHDPAASPHIAGALGGAPRDPEGHPCVGGSSEGAPHVPEGSPSVVGASKEAPPNPGGAPRNPEGSPHIVGVSKGAPPDPEGSPHIVDTPKGAPPDPEGSPTHITASSQGAPPKPAGAPPSPEASPQPAGGSSGIPPPSLGALRVALEAALMRDPGEATPAELSPLLGVPLPPPAKCRHLDGARLLRDNLRLEPGGPPGGLGALRTALSILEKYGRNLLQPRPPRHWRAVRFGNPVFRGTVGAIQGGRGVLRLLGYTEETGEGLSFPAGAGAPHGPRVAAVTADVLLLRAELDLLLANQHPNPQFFTDILAAGAEGPQVPETAPVTGRGSPADGTPPSRPHPDHAPLRLPSPTRGEPSSSLSPWPYGTGQPPGSMGQPPGSMGQPPGAVGQPPGSGEAGGGWACASCTFVNAGPSVLCGVCERPRLARRPPPAPQGWQCPHCTYWNEGSGRVCDVCHRTGGAAAPGPAPPRPGTPPGTGGDVGERPPAPAPAQEAERRRQERLREDGRRLVALVRAAEAQGVPAEAVVAAAAAAGGPAAAAVGRARAGLGVALGALAGAAGRRGAAEPGGPLGALSLREAARAWARARAHPQRALEACLGARRRQLRALAALGFAGRAEAAAALYQNGGDVWGALGDLQRRRLQPFLRRLWEPRQPPLDFDCPDQQALVRRALATLGLASWGRAQLVATLGRELGLGRAPRGLGELVEAVGRCPDRAVLRRLLRCECAVCGWGLPRHQMQWLTSCECPLCPECFRLHFTIGVKERRVGDLVCPACARPDLADEAQRLSYFSTLDIQLRQCLDPDTYQLFTQKLTELELMRDPKFIWCIQCSFGFIFEAEQGPAQCPQCQQRFCPRCQRPWDPQHATLSCAEFGAWLSARDPQAPPVGLAAFLQEHGIACPQCGVWYALARGGCMHFQCSQCRHHFCSGCYGPFHAKDRCPEPGCPLRGSLHGHHPRDCLFYLRDWEPPRLQRLLREGGVPFDTEPPAGARPVPGGGCGVLEQKETPAGLRDEPCGREAPPGHAGLCRGHYTEYLVRLINEHRLDPAPLYSAAELLAAAERHLPGGRPPRGARESDGEYEQRLHRLLAREAPLGARPARR